MIDTAKDTILAAIFVYGLFSLIADLYDWYVRR